MADLMKTMENQVIRDQLLELLREAGRNGANKKVIRMAMEQAGYRVKAEQVEEALYYLENKKLIQVTNCQNRALGISMDIYQITPEGIDVLEGTREESGIGVGSYGG